MRFAAPLALAVLLASVAAPRCRAQAIEHGTSAESVQSTVVVDDKTVQNGKANKADSGLTVGGRKETGAETARRDAVDVLEQGSVQGAPITQQTATATKVVVTDAAVVTGSAKDSACIQVGVIGAQDKCRPTTP